MSLLMSLICQKQARIWLVVSTHCLEYRSRDIAMSISLGIPAEKGGYSLIVYYLYKGLPTLGLVATGHMAQV